MTPFVRETGCRSFISAAELPGRCARPQAAKEGGTPLRVPPMANLHFRCPKIRASVAQGAPVSQFSTEKTASSVGVQRPGKPVVMAQKLSAEAPKQ